MVDLNEIEMKEVEPTVVSTTTATSKDAETLTLDGARSVCLLLANRMYTLVFSSFRYV